MDASLPPGPHFANAISQRVRRTTCSTSHNASNDGRDYDSSHNNLAASHCACRTSGPSAKPVASPRKAGSFDSRTGNS